MIIFDYEQFDQEKVYLLIGRIKNTKSLYDNDLNPHWSEKGRRYYDDERISRMVLGYILEKTADKPFKFNIEKANSKFLSMDTHEIDPYIKKAVIEAAEADYYYTYEKEW